jgi:hypothetical protein
MRITGTWVLLALAIGIPIAIIGLTRDAEGASAIVFPATPSARLIAAAVFWAVGTMAVVRSRPDEEWMLAIRRLGLLLLGGFGALFGFALAIASAVASGLLLSFDQPLLALWLSTPAAVILFSGLASSYYFILDWFQPAHGPNTSE